MRLHLLLPLAFIIGCKVDPCVEPGTVCAIAGDGEAGYGGDGADAREARFYRPMDVAWQPGTDNIVVTDWNNHRVRRILGDGTIETIVGADLPGDGPADRSDRVAPGAPGTEVGLNHPVQLEFGPDGKMYLPNWHNHKIRVWDPDTGLTLVTVANTDEGDGNGANAGFSGDGGPAEDALLAFPNSIAFTPDGNYYLLDQKNLRVRRIAADGTIDTVAGSGTYGFTGDGGAPIAASFSFVDDTTNLQPEPGGSIEADEDGVLYVADTYNHCIRRIDLATGLIEAVGGDGAPGYEGDGGMALEASFDTPSDLELGPDGRLYVMDRGNFVVRAIDLDTGEVETVLGTGETGFAEDGSPALEAPLADAWGIDFDGEGALLVADTWNNRILRVTP